MNKDELYMRRAIDLARRGIGNVSPNPLVGAVIVHNGSILGEGFHKEYGGPHAEVNAIHEVEKKELLAESTMYVTLEPCSHHGKTPPCADLLVEHSFKRVVIGMKDPNPLVAGRGIQRLIDAGIEVTLDVEADQIGSMNRPFIVNQLKNRPYILLKWAQTADGFIARTDYSSKWISGAESRTLVHKWRAESDAILVGANTVRHDDPALTVRDWTGNDPVRIVIDREHSLDESYKLFQSAPLTLSYTRKYRADNEHTQWLSLGDNMGWKQILADLYKRGIGILMVEGGAQILDSLIKDGYWDEARIFVSDSTFGEGISAPELPLHCLDEKIDIPDTLFRYINK
jgi:diaminohydroxyphosphoribosylaminopyrimidine deaminase/5-amino-6-(5-phosphoribosylamino)uracil reductase